MQFNGDYHLHTTYSDGRATAKDMVQAAMVRGLKEIGIADHGPANIAFGVASGREFLTIKAEMSQLQLKYPDICLMTGAEANVINLAGKIDLECPIIKELDYLIVGLHPFIWPAGLSEFDWLLENQLARFIVPSLYRRVKNLNTKALAEAIYNYDVWAISHPGLMMPIEIEEVAQACIRENTAWEINTGHQFPDYEQVLAAAECGVDFVVNSDAHYPETVGNFAYGALVLEKAGVETERVLNAIPESP